MVSKIIQLTTCLRCNYQWYPRSPQKPTICPKCKSPWWNKPRKEKKGEIKIV